MGNKTWGDFKSLKYPVLLELGDEGGCVATFPDLPGIVAEGEDFNEAYAIAWDLRKAWTETALEDGHEIPMPGSSNTRIAELEAALRELVEKSQAIAPEMLGLVATLDARSSDGMQLDSNRERAANHRDRLADKGNHLAKALSCAKSVLEADNETR